MAIKTSLYAVTHIFDAPYDIWYRSGEYVNGIFEYSDVQTKITGFRASIQPVKARELNFFPEGTQLTDAKFAYSVTPIPIDDYQYNPGNFDLRLIYPDETGVDKVYRIVDCLPWKGTYYRYLLVQTRMLDDVPTDGEVIEDGQ